MNLGMDFFNELFLGWGISPSLSFIIAKTLVLILVVLLAFSIEFIIRKIFLRTIRKIRSRLLAKNFLYFITAPHIIVSTCRLISPFLILTTLPLLIQSLEGDSYIQFFFRLCNVYIVVVILRIITHAMTAVYEVYSNKEEFKNRPLKGLLQTGQIIVLVIGAIIVISIFINKEPGYLLAGLGASAAVFMLVFQDSILGVVSGIQLSANNMLEVGDWITVPKHGADGTVIEVSLNTVKVQNFDKTITTLPPYALIKDSFQNWRGMSDSNARRVKRHINIDMSSIKFCTPEMLDNFKKIHLLKEYIKATEDEISQYNTDNNVNTDLLINGRNQTNLGVFRKYIDAYLKAHPRINNGEDFTCMVRQLQPTEMGMPLELYFFANTSSWLPYEDLQSDVFDHVLAAISTFDLKVFQTPSGSDMSKWSEAAIKN